MKKNVLLAAVFISLGSVAFSQSLFVPNGTAGIGNSLNGYVGIGTNNPTHHLNIVGTSRTVMSLGGPSTSASAIGDLMIKTSNGVPIGGSSYWIWSFRSDAWSGYSGDYTLYSHNGSSFTSPIIAQSDGDVILGAGNGSSRHGNVGIRTINPTTELDVHGTIKSVHGWGDWAQFETTSAGLWRVHNPQNQDYLMFGYDDGSGSGADFHLNIHKDGNVGIGTVSPSEKLDVDGNIVIGSSTAIGYGNGGKISLRRVT